MAPATDLPVPTGTALRTPGPRTTGLRSAGPKTGGPRTAGGTEIKTPWRARQHLEMQALMSSLPAYVTCICEICDCGRCCNAKTCTKAKKPKTGSKDPFPITHTHDMFKGVFQPPRSSKKPPPTPRETDIPPMVFETNQRDDFIPRPLEMRKPVIPPQSNFDRPTASLDGTSYYMQEFPAKKLSTPAKMLNVKHADMIKGRSDAKFYGDTTNMEHFKQWIPVTNKAAEEPPCFTGDILYPQKEKLPQSTTQQAFPGAYAPKPEQIKKAPDNLHIDGGRDFMTTTQDVYKGQFGPRADKFVPMPKPFVNKGPLMGETQNMFDYPKKSIERTKAIDPAQPTIDLKFDNKQSFETEQRSIFMGHDAVKNPVPKSFKKTPVKYERPAVPLEGLTVTHSVYTPKNLADAHIPMRPAPNGNFVRDLPKFDDATAFKDHYKNWGPRMPMRMTHADFADVYQPTEGKFEGFSTTKQTFKTPLQKCLQHLEGILTCIETMESILDMSLNINRGEQTTLESHLVERISTEFNQLQFYVSKCKGLPLVEQVKPRINRITLVLQQNLEGMFTEGLTTSNDEMLTRCLRTYITIDKVSDAESLFRRVEVNPYMTEFVCEAYIRQKGGSFAMYSKILEFQQLKCSLLQSVIRAKSGQEPLKGYDFMVNSVWPEVVDLLETKASSVFAPGNPDKFYKEYQDGMEFLSSFESQCGTIQSVTRLRQHSSYERFMHKWSLPVYFQIRLQEIAGKMEKCYINPWAQFNDSQEYKLALVSTVIACVHMCWKQGIYLHSLSHRFWKLTLQVLSRYATWLAEISNGEIEIEYTVEKSAMARPSSRVDMLKGEGSGRSSPVSRSESPVVTTETRRPNSDELMTVISDSYTLITAIRESLESTIISALQADDTQRSLLEAGISESCDKIRDQLHKIQSIVSEDIVTSVTSLIKQVSDIPRLYRRTNKEVPSKPSGYIQQATQQLLSFREQYKLSLPQTVLIEVIASVVISIFKSYEETTCEVLLSVKKMEDSLKRLKRGKSTASLVGNMSDDDKIRTQIWLDVQQLSTQAAELGVETTNIPSYDKLYTEVQQALPNRQTDTEPLL